MLAHNPYAEPPAWDAFSKVNLKNLDPSEYEDVDESGQTPTQKKKSTAVVKAKPTTINGWDPETRTQKILTDEDMQNGSGMGAMDMDDWRVTSLEARDVGKEYDCSHGAKTILKMLLEPGAGDNPHPPAQVEITYTGRLLLDGLVFDDAHATQSEIFEFDEARDGRFPVISPAGLGKAIRTMRTGERAKFTIEAAAGFGSEGAPSLGVLEDAALEYEVHLHRLIPVTLHDGVSIVKRRLHRPPPPKATPGAPSAASGLVQPTPQPNAEVVVRWGGVLSEDGYMFRQEAEERFWLGDPCSAPWWVRILSSFQPGETSELLLDAVAAFGDAGSTEYDVPPATPLRVTATLVSFVGVDDLTSAHGRVHGYVPGHDADRAALKRILAAGSSLSSPIARYDVRLDWCATVIPTPPASLPAVGEPAAAAAAALEAVPPSLERSDDVCTLGAAHPQAAELAVACGGRDVCAALDLLLQTMRRGETAELVCAPSYVGGDAAHSLRLVATVHSWVRVDEVDGTGGAVLKRVLHEPVWAKGMPAIEIPKPEATCAVRYTCRLAGHVPSTAGGGEGEVLEAAGDAFAAVQFVQGERSVLPCVEMAVLQMKRGERALLYAPAVWAYGAPGFPPAAKVAEEHRGCAVEVELELCSLEQPQDTNGQPMDVQTAVHLRRKDAGNLLHSKGALHEAVAKWELAVATLPSGNSLRYDLSRGGRPEEEVDAQFATIQKVQLSTHLNLANVLLKLAQPQKAQEHSDKALAIDPSSVKALFRRAQAKMRLEPVDVESVRADLTAAARLDPKSKEVRLELEHLKNVLGAQTAKERSLYGGMFAKAEAAEQAKPPPPPPPPLPKAFGERQQPAEQPVAFGRRST